VDFLERTRNGYDAAAAEFATLESVGLPVYSTAVREPDDDGAAGVPDRQEAPCSLN
jgi:hypothetical protein